MTQKPLSGIALYKNRREASFRLSLPHRGRGTASAVDRVLSSAVICAKTFSICIILFHTMSALSAPAGHLPLEGKACDTRIPSSKQATHHPCEPMRSPSTVIPSVAEGSLLHCRHMHTCALTQTTPWCFLFGLSLTHGLPVCKKDPSTSVGMTFKGNG